MWRSDVKLLKWIAHVLVSRTRISMIGYRCKKKPASYCCTKLCISYQKHTNNFSFLSGCKIQLHSMYSHNNFIHEVPFILDKSCGRFFVLNKLPIPYYTITLNNNCRYDKIYLLFGTFIYIMCVPFVFCLGTATTQLSYNIWKRK